MDKNNNYYNISLNNIDEEYDQEQEKKKKRSNKFYIGCFVIICSIILLVVLIYNFGIKSSQPGIVPLNTIKNVEKFFEKKVEIDKNVTKKNLKFVRDVVLMPKFMKVEEYGKKQIFQYIEKRSLQNTLYTNFERKVMSKLLSCEKIDITTIEAYFILLQNIYSKQEIPFVFRITFPSGDFKDFKMDNLNSDNKIYITNAVNTLNICIIYFEILFSKFIPFLAILNQSGATIYNISPNLTENDVKNSSDMKWMIAAFKSILDIRVLKVEINDKIKIENDCDYRICICALARSFALGEEMLEERPNLIYWRLKIAQEMFLKDKK